MTELMLKLAAFLAMVIDHAAACRLDRVFFPAFSKVYMISRAIGRMAFPIYAFCLRLKGRGETTRRSRCIGI